jgi:hypothetical protein
MRWLVIVVLGAVLLVAGCSTATVGTTMTGLPTTIMALVTTTTAAPATTTTIATSTATTTTATPATSAPGTTTAEEETTATAAAAKTSTYTDPDYGYSFDYPASWKIQKQPTVDVTAGGAAVEGVGAIDPRGATLDGSYIDMMLLSIFKLKVTVHDSMIPQLKGEIESVIRTMEGQEPSAKVEEALAETTAARMKGYRVTYTFTRGDTPVTSTLYFLFSGNIEYQLTTQAATGNWNTDHPIFDAMIASLKPGPAR